MWGLGIAESEGLVSGSSISSGNPKVGALILNQRSPKPRLL